MEKSDLKTIKKLFALIHTKINCQKSYVSPEHVALLVLFSTTPVTCSVSLEIFVTNCSPDKMQDPDV